MRSIAKTSWGALIACVPLSAGSAGQRAAQVLETADSASEESIQQQTQAHPLPSLMHGDYRTMFFGPVFKGTNRFENGPSLVKQFRALAAG